MMFKGKSLFQILFLFCCFSCLLWLTWKPDTVFRLCTLFFRCWWFKNRPNRHHSKSKSMVGITSYHSRFQDKRELPHVEKESLVNKVPLMSDRLCHFFSTSYFIVSLFTLQKKEIHLVAQVNIAVRFLASIMLKAKQKSVVADLFAWLEITKEMNDKLGLCRSRKIQKNDLSLNRSQLTPEQSVSLRNVGMMAVHSLLQTKRWHVHRSSS